MSEMSRIQDQLRRALEGNAWHGPSLNEVLKGVGPAAAAAKPVRGAHGIWELVRHLTAWAAFVRRRLEGERIVDVPDEEDWPAVDVTDATAWDEARAALAAEHRRLVEVMGTFGDDRLDEIVPGRPDSFYVMLHGVVQHVLYHAGQIALLRKAAATR